MDDEWATVGSSNLDPLSLALNLEANVIIRDRAFNQHLYERLDCLMQHSCQQIEREALGDLRGWGMVRSFLAYHFTRRYPRWASWLPRHVPRLLPALDRRLDPAYPGPRSERWDRAPCLARNWPSRGRAGPRRARRAIRARAAGGTGPSASRRWLFFLAVLALLIRYGRNVDWEDVLDSVRNTPAPALMAAIGLAADQPSALQLLRPDRPPLHRPRPADAHGDGGELHQLCVQPVHRLAGGRRRLPLPAVLAAGPGQRRDHPHRVDEHAHQLAGLQAARRASCSSCIRWRCRRAGRWATTDCNGWAPA